MDELTMFEDKDKVMCTKCLKEETREGKKTCATCAQKAREYWHKTAKFSKVRAARIAKGRKKALASKDAGEKRAYVKKTPTISPLVMRNMISELEWFISRLPVMSAQEYLEGRETLIKTILIKGKA